VYKTFTCGRVYVEFQDSENTKRPHSWGTPKAGSQFIKMLSIVKQRNLNWVLANR